VVNPWSAINSNYANMYNFPSPHTYNNPDVCNNVWAGLAACNINDTISSEKNRDASYSLRLYNDANFSGGFETLGPLNSVNRVTYNDQITSFCWNTGKVCTF